MNAVASGGSAATTPVVSVVTIAFRDLDGLRRTVDSVSSQTYGALQHIVIDGGSGTSTERYLESRNTLHYWHSRPDGGRYHAMNEGARRASGDILWWLHAGDSFATTSAVTTMVDLLTGGGAASPRDRWGYGRVMRRTAGGEPLGEWGYVPFDRRAFEWGIRPIPHQATAVGADLFDEVGPYDERFGLAADHLLMADLARRRAPRTSTAILADFDATGAGSVRTVREHHADIRRTWDTLGATPLRSRAASVVASHVLGEYVTARASLARRVRGRR